MRANRDWVLLRLKAPLVVCSLIACDACGGDPAPPDVSCDKTVYVHIANYNYFDEPSGGNGCWKFERNHASGQGTKWSECDYAADPIKYLGNDATGHWDYNETRFAHAAAGDEGALIDKCYALLAKRGVRPQAQGVAYMEYAGMTPHWRTTQAKHVSRYFAELYGYGFYPAWNEWKANPVGRPMVNMTPPNSYPKEAYDVIKNVCEYIDSGSWMGIYSYADTRNGSIRMNEIVEALNDCTAKKASTANTNAPPDDNSACFESTCHGDAVCSYNGFAQGSNQSGYCCKEPWVGEINCASDADCPNGQICSLGTDDRLFCAAPGDPPCVP